MVEVVEERWLCVQGIMTQVDTETIRCFYIAPVCPASEGGPYAIISLGILESQEDAEPEVASLDRSMDLF